MKSGKRVFIRTYIGNLAAFRSSLTFKIFAFKKVVVATDVFDHSHFNRCDVRGYQMVGG